jgi:hypothetical protein
VPSHSLTYAESSTRSLAHFVLTLRPGGARSSTCRCARCGTARGGPPLTVSMYGRGWSGRIKAEISEAFRHQAVTRCYPGLGKWTAKAPRLHRSRDGEGGTGDRKSGRGDWIRTSDPLRPRQVRYQAALRPDPAIIPRPGTDPPPALQSTRDASQTPAAEAPARGVPLVQTAQGRARV